MTESEARPEDEGATFASAEMQAAVEALAETGDQAAEGSPSEGPAPTRRRRRAGSASAESVEPQPPDEAMHSEEPVRTAELRRSSRAEIQAGAIALRQGSIGRAEAESIEVVQGAVGMARGEQVQLKQGFLGLGLGNEVHLEQSFARFVAARETVSLRTSGAWNVLADKVDVAPGSGVVFLVARRVEGDVRPLFDWRGALAFGVAMGLVGALFRGRGPRRERRSRPRREPRRG